ncbi:hypothetical protein [Shewanella algae]|uniref:hypothetical protein n=1 Tax=Shewanella algae TaxID=38313 RepID=UPI001AACF953|nr:hypothetical protein [Shewanella algae]MBO2556542.1 hypothetical protein [Shewanella algae]MBO2573476.1 hypothetical protein [Shewanella algae]
MNYNDIILRQLDDESFPPIVLLNGKWGTGKTYYVQTELKVAINSKYGSVENSKILYLSLYGVNTIDDFKDKLIANFIFNDENYSKYSKDIRLFLRSMLDNIGFKGSDNLLTSISGITKYKLYDSISNAFIILDDYERVPDVDLRRRILGEVLEISEKNRNRFIILADQDKCPEIDDFEKVISHSVKFEYKPERTVEIALIKYGHFFDQEDKDEILRTVKSIDIKNIRVLKRSLVRVILLTDKIKSIESVDFKKSKALLISNVIRICFAYYDCKIPEVEILNNSSGFILSLMGDSKELTENEEKLRRILGEFPLVNKKLVNYCINGILDFVDYQAELNLPYKIEKTHFLMPGSDMTKISEDEFLKAINEVIESIKSNSEAIQITKWYRLCDQLMYFFKNDAFCSDFIDSEQFWSICENKSVDCFIPLEDQELKYFSVPNVSFFSERLYTIYKKKYESLREKSFSIESGNLDDKFINDINSLCQYIFENYTHKPKFSNISKDVIVKALTKWTHKEILIFLDFLNERYNFVNLNEFFHDEYIFYEEMLNVINEQLKDTNKSLKKHYLERLCNRAKQIYKILKVDV